MHTTYLEGKQCFLVPPLFPTFHKKSVSFCYCLANSLQTECGHLIRFWIQGPQQLPILAITTSR